MACRILIADDNERVRRGVSELLPQEPMYEVCGEAVNGSEALQKAASLKPDLILLDISMPDIDGLQWARVGPERIARDPDTGDKPARSRPGAAQGYRGRGGCLRR